MAKLGIFLVDDHSFVREGLKSLIDAQPDMEVIGEASDGKTALRQARDCAPDIMVMDISMPQMNGTQATRELRQQCPQIKVLVLSMHEDASYFRNLLEAGASGYVLKRSAPRELVQALRSVASGGTYLDPALAGKVLSGFVQRQSLRGEIAGQELSEREENVLRLIAQGHSNKEVAQKLTISIKTVETYKARGMEKLNLESRVDLMRHAVQQNWLSDL